MTFKKGEQNGTPFQKGNRLAVGRGRPKLTVEQKAMQITTRTQFKVLLSKYMVLTLKKIQDLLEEKELPAIDMAVLKHLEQMIENGSMDRVDWLADHIMGAKPKQTEIAITANNKVDMKKLSTEQIKHLKEISEANDNE